MNDLSSESYVGKRSENSIEFNLAQIFAEVENATLVGLNKD